MWPMGPVTYSILMAVMCWAVCSSLSLAEWTGQRSVAQLSDITCIDECRKPSDKRSALPGVDGNSNPIHDYWATPKVAVAGTVVNASAMLVAIADANAHAIAIHIDTIKDVPSDAACILRNCRCRCRCTSCQISKRKELRPFFRY